MGVAVLLRSGALALLWLALTGGELASWIVGAPAVALATWVSVLLLPPSGFSVLRFTVFLPRFFLRSLWAALEVAWWALHPRMPLHPAMCSYVVRLESETSRVFFLNLISLQPGTLSVEIEGPGRLLTVHALNAQRDPTPALAALEREVARLFAETLA
jgi:multicomponent Na+:H+ antiporter subunit E